MSATLVRDEIENPDAEDAVPVFVYGTLRYGEGNYQWCSDAVVAVLRDCHTDGRIYWVSGRSGYPVAKLDEEGEIIGDILWFDPSHRAYHDVVAMEIGAGYEVRKVSVRCQGGELREASAFHYVRAPRGHLIPSGDWVREDTSMR